MKDMFLQLNPFARTLIIVALGLFLIIVFNQFYFSEYEQEERILIDQRYPDAALPEEKIGQDEPVGAFDAGITHETIMQPQPDPQEVSLEALSRKPQAPAEIKNVYSIQIASFKNENHAKKLAQSLKADNRIIDIVKPENSMFYRVYIGRYSTKAAAQEELPHWSQEYQGSFIKYRTQ